MLTFEQLQQEVREWADRNFPEAKPHMPLLGLTEEVGELAHAHLKLEQNIRMEEDHLAGKFDAVGDVLVYLADYCGRNGIDMQDAIEHTWGKVKQRDWQANPNDAHQKV